MKPLLKWSGGKRKELFILKKWFPSHFDLYIEPFVGGGAVFFDICPKKAVISDVHKELIIFYNQIKNKKNKEIKNLMSKFSNNAETYYYIRDKFILSCKVEKAFVFYYLRKTCFRGMLRYNSDGKFNIPFGNYSTYNYKELSNDSYVNLLQRTTIYKKDFRWIFEKYNDKNNFMFLDPPYDYTFKDYGYGSFDKKDHEDLSELFKKTDNKCLLVVSKSKFLEKLYKDYIKYEYDKKYAFKLYNKRISNSIHKKHLIITNYSLDENAEKKFGIFI